jgi:hypothetical protein
MHRKSMEPAGKSTERSGEITEIGRESVEIVPETMESFGKTCLSSALNASLEQLIGFVMRPSISLFTIVVVATLHHDVWRGGTERR